MLVRSSCIGLSHYKVHIVSGLVIFTAVLISMLNFTTTYYHENMSAYVAYTSLFLLCTVFNAMSHALKESIVRSQPVDQTLFNFKVSVSQLLCGLIIFPAIAAVSKQYENYDGSPLQPYQESTFSVFFEHYISYGFGCIFDMTPQNDGDRCEFSLLYIIGYVLSIFIISVSLTAVSVF